MEKNYLNIGIININSGINMKKVILQNNFLFFLNNCYFINMQKYNRFNIIAIFALTFSWDRAQGSVHCSHDSQLFVIILKCPIDTSLAKSDLIKQYIIALKVVNSGNIRKSIYWSDHQAQHRIRVCAHKLKSYCRRRIRRSKWQHNCIIDIRMRKFMFSPCPHSIYHCVSPHAHSLCISIDYRSCTAIMVPSTCSPKPPPIYLTTYTSFWYVCFMMIIWSLIVGRNDCNGFISAISLVKSDKLVNITIFKSLIDYLLVLQFRFDKHLSHLNGTLARRRAI